MHCNIFNLIVEQEITFEVLKVMTPRHCELLLKDFSLGKLIKFEHHLKLWQIEEKSTVSSFQSVDANSLYTRNENENDRPAHKDESFEQLRKLDLKNILNHTSQGRSISENYRMFKTLTDGSRNILVDVIINYLIQNDIKMTVKLSENIADQIIQIFPTEYKV